MIYIMGDFGEAASVEFGEEQKVTVTLKVTVT